MRRTTVTLSFSASSSSLLFRFICPLLLLGSLASSSSSSSSSSSWMTSSEQDIRCRRGQATSILWGCDDGRPKQGFVDISVKRMSQPQQQQQQQQDPFVLDSVLMKLRGGQDSHDSSNNMEEQESADDDAAHGYKILKDEVLHNKWRKLVRRTVQFPPRKKEATTNTEPLVADFEVISQGDHGGTVSDEAVLVFVWNRATKSATLIREYMPSNHRFVYGLAAGMVEKKHSSNGSGEEHDNSFNNGSMTDMASQEERQRRIAAEYELEEECRLHGGEWLCLCEPTTLDKYSTTRLSVYLVIDPQPVDEADVKPRDETEQGMQVIPGMSITKLVDMMAKGKMTVVGVWATQLALHKLRMLEEIESTEY